MKGDCLNLWRKILRIVTYREAVGVRRQLIAVVVLSVVTGGVAVWGHAQQERILTESRQKIVDAVHAKYGPNVEVRFCSHWDPPHCGTPPNVIEVR